MLQSTGYTALFDNVMIDMIDTSIILLVFRVSFSWLFSVFCQGSYKELNCS
jgi:hypothetical protein